MNCFIFVHCSLLYFLDVDHCNHVILQPIKLPGLTELMLAEFASISSLFAHLSLTFQSNHKEKKN